MRTTDTLIIGAGPAGLAMGACLRRAGVPFEIVEKSDAITPSWRGHYDRLHLHTARRFSSLPYHPMPADLPRYVPRLDFVRYLEDYASAFDLRPHFGTTVRAIHPDASGWRVETDGEMFRAARVVVAAGYNRVPHRPSWPGLDDFAGEVLHSSTYRNGDPWTGQPVLVVGCGNSGAEIAVDLVERGARPGLVVRGPVHVIRRQVLGLPSQYASVVLSYLPRFVRRAAFAFAQRFVLPDLTPLGFVRPARSIPDQIAIEGRIPLIDLGTIDRVRSGEIEVVPGIERIEGSDVIFSDGRRRSYAAIVLATGYRTGLADFVPDIEGLLNDRGQPAAFGAPIAHAPGLYFIGYANPMTGALREIAIEARRVAAHIGRASSVRSVADLRA